MSVPSEQTAQEFLEVLVKVRHRGLDGFGVREALHLLLVGLYRQGVFDGGGQEALDRLDRRHHAAKVEDGVGGGADGDCEPGDQSGRNLDHPLPVDQHGIERG
jgi:hypothetical protein